MKSEVVAGLELLKEVFESQLQELDRCNEKAKELEAEIEEIDSMIGNLNELNNRRQREYEKGLRANKRMRNRELRKRIFFGLRMEPVGAGGNPRMEHPGSDHLGRLIWEEER